MMEQNPPTCKGDESKKFENLKNLFGDETRKKCEVERKTETLNGVKKKRGGKGCQIK